jgi:hypothetical protein
MGAIKFAYVGGTANEKSFIHEGGVSTKIAG